MKLKWKGKELKTFGDIMDVMKEIDSKREARRFMKLYRADTKYADKNIGYMTGYFPSNRARDLQMLFGVKHPIFGNIIPTTEEAFEKGKEMVKK